MYLHLPWGQEHLQMVQLSPASSNPWRFSAYMMVMEGRRSHTMRPPSCTSISRQHTSSLQQQLS
jgi:hypothetical protein